MSQHVLAQNGDSAGGGVEGLAREWMEAYNSGDSLKLASLYTEDAMYVSPHVPALTLDGRSAIAANFLRGRRGGGRIDSVTVLSSSVSGDVAYAVCRYDATNSGQKVNGRNVIVLRKAGGKWLFAVHASVVKD